MPDATKLVYLTLERLCARFTSRLIAVSRPTIEKGLGFRICPEEKFALIYNGIDLERYSRPVDRERVLYRLGLDPQFKTVGMVGRLDEQKNPLDFVRAAADVAREYPNVQFLIAGDGALRPDCERLIFELGLRNKFLLLGYRSDVDLILPSLDVVAMSSLWEGLPLVFQEAMSAGKPIVANDVDGVSDIVSDGETGFLVTPHRPREMAERIGYLLDHDSVRASMGETAQARSVVFSSERMTEAIEALYRELLAARATPGRQPGFPRPAVWKRSA
jgi:glycosyltransferase involved in cell wall biosynthesis